MLKKGICLCSFTIFLSFYFNIYVFSTNYNIDFVPTCETLYLVNLDTETEIYDKNAEKKMYPASLTKIMTYIVVVENVQNLDEQISIKKEMINNLLGTGSSVSGIKVDDVVTIKQLLHCLMIKSGNDAAMALAYYIGKGNINEFVDKMNKKACELGCKSTHFVNPHGLHDENHYTCAKDLSFITKYAIKLPNFMEICSMTTSYAMGPDKFPLVTTNKMIDQARGGMYYYRYAKGIKTGHTDEAGYCLVSTATYNEYNYLCIALGAPTKDSTGNPIANNYAMLDSRSIYKWAFTNLEFKKVLKKSESISEIKVNLTTKKNKLLLYPIKDYSALLPKSVNISSVNVRIEKPDFVNAPIEPGQKIATAVLTYANKEIDRIDLVSEEKVDQNIILCIIQYINNIIASIWFKIFIIVFIFAIMAIIYLRGIFFKKNNKKRKHAKMHKKFRIKK